MPDFRVYLVRGRHWTLEGSEGDLRAARRLAQCAMKSRPEIDRARIVRGFDVVETLDRATLARSAV